MPPSQPMALDGITIQRNSKDLPFGFMKGFNYIPPMSDDEDEEKKSDDGDEAIEVTDESETREKIPQVELEEIAQRLKKNKDLTYKMEKNAQKTAATFDAIIAKYELLEYTKGAEDDEVSEEEDVPPKLFSYVPDLNGPYIKDRKTKKWKLFVAPVVEREEAEEERGDGEGAGGEGEGKQ